MKLIILAIILTLLGVSNARNVQYDKFIYSLGSGSVSVCDAFGGETYKTLPFKNVDDISFIAAFPSNITTDMFYVLGFGDSNGDFVLSSITISDPSLQIVSQFSGQKLYFNNAPSSFGFDEKTLRVFNVQTDRNTSYVLLFTIDFTNKEVSSLLVPGSYTPRFSNYPNGAFDAVTGNYYINYINANTQQSALQVVNVNTGLVYPPTDIANTTGTFDAIIFVGGQLFGSYADISNSTYYFYSINQTGKVTINEIQNINFFQSPKNPVLPNPLVYNSIFYGIYLPDNEDTVVYILANVKEDLQVSGAISNPVIYGNNIKVLPYIFETK